MVYLGLDTADNDLGTAPNVDYGRGFLQASADYVEYLGVDIFREVPKYTIASSTTLYMKARFRSEENTVQTGYLDQATNNPAYIKAYRIA